MTMMMLKFTSTMVMIMMAANPANGNAGNEIRLGALAIESLITLALKQYIWRYVSTFVAY